ncbi:MAG: NYN domain-containing protein [Bacillota bacterium]
MKEVLLVDGYNVINAWPELLELSLAQARAKLYDLLASYAHYRDIELILVFDAHLRMDPESVEYGPITEVFTASGETADRYIERTVRALQGEGRSISVASSDALIQIMVLNYARRMSARELIADISKARKELEDAYLSPLSRRRGTLEQRLGSAHLAAFERMRRE